MSSNIKIIKVCEYCKKEFVARKTTSRTCSDACAKRFYKLKQKERKIAQTEIETEIKRRPSVYIREDELRVIQLKDNLTLKEAAILLNISPLTLRRWILSGKLKSRKVGKKHLLAKSDLVIQYFKSTTRNL
jgi:excisionase family DNA binding protein